MQRFMLLSFASGWFPRLDACVLVPWLHLEIDLRERGVTAIVGDWGVLEG